MWPLTPLNQALSIAILLLSLALGASMLHGRALKAERDAKTLEIEHMRNAAQAYRDQSEITAKAINDDHRLKVEQARKTAYANYLKKYGANAACGISVRLPNMPAGIGETDSAGEPDAGFADDVPDPVRELAEQCAETTVIATQWQAWARANDLEVQ